jgi:multiple sugar transport system permease protein
MENNEYMLPTLDLSAGYKPTDIAETDTVSDHEIFDPTPNRSFKERLDAAMAREKEVFLEDKEWNKESFSQWKANKKSEGKELLSSMKEKIKSLPSKAKDAAIALPGRIANGVKAIPEKLRSIKWTPKLIKKIITVSLLGIWGLIVLFPFYWMILTSFKSYGSYNQETIPQFIAKDPTIENYLTAFKAVPLADYFLNTIIFTLLTTGAMLIVTVLAAYGFARINFKGKNLVFTLFLSLMMIPAELVIITNFVTVTNWDMRNSFEGLILPSITSVFYIYLLKENFQQVPNELYYAAKVDGTSDLKYMFKVMVPICQPTIVTVTILKVIECWNSYVWPRLITDDEDYFLVSNGIQAIREGGFGRENIPAMMAAVVAISIPLIILFLIFRNKIMEGVARGGTKG